MYIHVYFMYSCYIKIQMNNSKDLLIDREIESHEIGSVGGLSFAPPAQTICNVPWTVDSDL